MFIKAFQVKNNTIINSVYGLDLSWNQTHPKCRLQEKLRQIKSDKMDNLLSRKFQIGF